MKPTYEELERQLEESRREFRAADATIHNLELKLTDLAVHSLTPRASAGNCRRITKKRWSHLSRQIPLLSWRTKSFLRLLMKTWR